MARALGYRFLDTGSMYRALAWLVVRQGIDPRDEEAVASLAAAATMEVESGPTGSPEQSIILVDGLDATPYLRSPEVEAAVSWVSSVPRAREVMVELQRRLAGGGGVVVAGRDIGTVVLPDADLKVYLDASTEVRASRRQSELASMGESFDPESVLRELVRRDAIDSTRDASPLRPAADAVVIDTDGLTLDEVVDRVLSLVRCL